MSRKALAPLLAALMGLAVVAPASAHRAAASGKVLMSRTSAPGTNSVYLASSLAPHHWYRIDITTAKKAKFSGSAFEEYVYIYQHHMGTGTHNFSLLGTAPHSLTVSQPVKYSIDTWQLVIDVGALTHTSITVKLVDLGKH